jgi:hypothetical protein
MILRWLVHDFKLQLFSPEIATVAKANIECYSTQRVIGASRDDSMERAICRLEKFHGDMHYPKGFCVD